MKHFITFVFILLSYLSYGQITGTQVLAFQGNVTSTIRDGLDVPSGQYWMIYNTTTLQLEVSDDTDTWTAFSAGTDDQTASEVPITDAGGIITATDVEGALQENRTAIDLNTAKVTNATHTGDVTGSGALTIATGAVAADELASTTVTPGSYTNTDLTVDADGRITAASSGSAGGFSGSIADTQVAFGTGADAIGGDADLTYNSTTNLLTAGGFFTAGSLEGRRTILNTAGASADEWVILISNEESPEVLFQLWDGGYGVGPVIENYSLHVGTPVDAADLIDLAFLQAGLDDLGGVLDASAFSGNLATTDDTLQELADAVDGLVTGGGLANVVEDTTPELGGNLDALNFAVSNLLEAEWVYTTGTNAVFTGFSAGNDNFRLAAPNDASQSLRYTFSTGLWFYPYSNTTSGLTANNLQSAIDEIVAGGGNTSLATADQAIPAATTRIIDTDAAGSSLSFENSTVEVMRVGGNNDNAVYVLGLEALTGNTIASVSPIALAEVDTGLNAASGYTGAVVKDANVLYYSDGADWQEIAAGDGIEEHPESGLTGLRIGAGTEAERDAATLGASDVWLCTDCVDLEYLVIPITAQGANIEVGTFVNSTPYPVAITITNVWAYLGTAPTGSVATFDINEHVLGGATATILSTKITIDATENSSSTAATPPVISDASIAAFSELIVDVDGVGSSVPGATGTIMIEFYKN